MKYLLRRYRRKGFGKESDVQASCWDGTPESYQFLRGWTVNNVERDGRGTLLVQTPEGVAEAVVGDFVVKVGEGAFCPRQGERFLQQYDVVEANSEAR